MFDAVSTPSRSSPQSERRETKELNSEGKTKSSLDGSGWCAGSTVIVSRFQRVPYVHGGDFALMQGMSNSLQVSFEGCACACLLCCCLISSNARYNACRQIQWGTCGNASCVGAAALFHQNSMHM